jgi:hypothetical protein
MLQYIWELFFFFNFWPWDSLIEILERNFNFFLGMELNFVAPAAKNGEKVVLVSDEDIASGVKTWENALVGYVWGPIPSTEYDMPIDRLFLDKLILKFVDLECRKYGNVKFYSKGLGVYLFDFESFEAKQLVSDKGGEQLL